MFSGLYPNTSGFSDATPLLDNWDLGSSDPLQSKAGALVTFCFPHSTMLNPGPNTIQDYETLKDILTADNVKHFYGLYRHYQSHWPMIHNTFNPMVADDGLVLTMVCIGAVYSDRLGVNVVRWLMELVRASVFRSSRVYRFVVEGAQEAVTTNLQSANIEEIQALVHIHSLFVWHGTREQRKQGRDEFWALASIARLFGLLQPLPDGHANFSALHQPGPVLGDEVNTWTWTSWIEQERRARVMYLIFLIDASLAIFFNAQPQFDMYDLKLPLPADDASWEARTEEDCASALGLRGESAQNKNLTGSRRPKQLGMSEALQFLHQGGDFPQRATNVYSKFILIHAIHVQIFKIQRKMLNVSSSAAFSSGTSTPRSLNEWSPPTDGTISNGSSGHATPTEGLSSVLPQTQQMLRLTMTALELWKRQWDADMQIQYPQHQRRVGFCRDGIHFYFLAKLFLRSSRREDWAAKPDVRCQQVFHLLKQIRAHVASESASKGLDIGSVTTVDDNYGIADLTLNMKLLFTPISAAP